MKGVSKSSTGPLSQPGVLTNRPRSNSEIQGAAALMNLNRPASSMTNMRPIVTPTPPTDNPSSYTVRRDGGASPSRMRRNSFPAAESNRMVLPTRNRGRDYCLQEGSINNQVGQVFGNFWRMGNHNPNSYPGQQGGFIVEGSRSPRLQGPWYRTSTPFPPLLRFRANNYDRHRAFIGLVRAPIGSTSRLGNSQWQLASPHEAPDFIISNTPADRQLNIFYVPDADRTFPGSIQARFSPLLQAPRAIVGVSSPNLVPEEDSSEAQMGSGDRENAVENGQNTIINEDPPYGATTNRNLPRATIVIDDDPPQVRPRTVNWPQDVGTLRSVLRTDV